MWGMGETEHQEIGPGMHGAGELAPQTPVASDDAQVTVEIRDFDFFPRDLTLKAGVGVTWVNLDAAPHDATDAAGAWRTDILYEGESATLTFDFPGSYEYVCSIHPTMQAALTVV